MGARRGGHGYRRMIEQRAQVVASSSKVSTSTPKSERCCRLRVWSLSAARLRRIAEDTPRYVSSLLLLRVIFEVTAVVLVTLALRDEFRSSLVGGLVIAVDRIAAGPEVRSSAPCAAPPRQETRRSPPRPVYTTGEFLEARSKDNTGEEGESIRFFVGARDGFEPRPRLHG